MYREKLLSKLENLNQELDTLIKRLQSYNDDEALNTKPGEGVWSPMQVLNHLLISEKLSLAYCKKKLSFEPELKEKNLKTWFNDRLITLSLNSPFKFKAPNLVNQAEFPDGDTLDNILGQWLPLRNELKQFLESVPEKYIGTEVYKHPFGFRMSLGGMLDFYKAHFRRHRKQLLRRLP